jgi:hypothetical protein
MTLLDMVRAMLLRANLPAPFWAEAIDTANKIRNRLPTRSLPNNISPHEAWFGVTPPTDHFREFGCLAFARISDKVLPRGNKISPRSIECCFLGYVGNKIYRLWNPITKQIVISRDVVFQEDHFLDRSHFVNIPQSTIAFQTPFDNVLDDEDRDPDDFTNLMLPPLLQYRPTPQSRSDISPSSTTPSQRALMAPIPRPSFPDDPDSDLDDDAPPPPPSRQPSPRQDTPLPPPQDPILPPLPTLPTPPSPRKSSRHRERSDKAKEADAGAKLATSTSPLVSTTPPPSSYIPSFAPPTEPQSLDEALTSPQSSNWQKAILEELNSHSTNSTWKYVHRPYGRAVIGSKFVFKLKDSETPTP